MPDVAKSRGPLQERKSGKILIVENDVLRNAPFLEIEGDNYSEAVLRCGSAIISDVVYDWVGIYLR